MAFLKNVLTDKRLRKPILSFVLSLLLLVSLIFSTYQITAWFKNQLIVDNPVELTNFTDKIEYSFNNGTSWTLLEKGSAIPLTIQNGTLKEQVQVRITHTGNSAAYLRFMMFGGFYNANTNTQLPQTDNFWSISSNAWTAYNGYYYYPEKLIKDQDAKDDELNQMVDTFTVSADISALGNISSYQDYEGELYIIAESVQPDRYPVFWGMDTLPFTVS